MDIRQPRAKPGHKGGVTRVDQIAQSLTERIRSGELPAGSRMQSVRGLAQQSGVSIQTALRAYDKLVAQGYLEARRGSGFYVRHKGHPPPTTQTWQFAQATDHDWRELLHSHRPYAQRIGCGSLPESWLDKAALSAAIRAIGPSAARSLSDYADVQGYLPLRQQLQLKLHEYGIDADPRQIVVTAGATDALHLVIWSNLLLPGHYALAEDPVPPIHLQRLLAAGLEIIRIPRGPDGPDIDALRAACIKYKPSTFLCSSLLHNPTSYNLSPNKAFQVLQLAEEFNLLIVDDCTYADLLPFSPLSRHVPLATLDQLNRVIHIGSFSKTLAPGLRVGFAAASPKYVELMTLFKSAGAINSPVLGERLAYHLLSQGKYRHHCGRLHTRLHEKRERLIGQLRERGFAPEPTTSGIYLWLSLGEGVDAKEIAAAMHLHGHITAPAYDFFSKSPRYASYMRLNVAVACDNPVLDLLAEEVALARKVGIPGARTRR